MKGFKKVLPIILFLILLIAVSIGTAYAAVSVADLPIKLPFRDAVILDGSIPGQTRAIMNQWANITLYEPSQKYETVEDLIESGEIEDIPEIDDKELLNMFPVIDSATLEKYLTDHPEYIENGYEKLFIDKVDPMNTPTGIKTIHGDDVLAIDAINGIVIVGKDVVSSTGTSKVKIALINDKSQIDMSLVKDLSIWEILEDQAKRSEAVLAINASNYTWNEVGQYAILYGATKYHGNVIRKSVETKDLVGFDQDGNFSIGSPVESVYNAVEGSPTLVKDGEVYQKPSENEIRCAMTAIGQTKDGVTIMMIGSGGTYGSKLGVTYSELAEIFKTYEASNAVALSGGSRTVMYWNGRIVNETVGYNECGVRLPNAFIVKQYKTSNS